MILREGRDVRVVERWSPAAWIHGHTHSSFDYEIGNTRIMCNPRGYEAHANPKFVKDFLLDL